MFFVPNGNADVAEDETIGTQVSDFVNIFWRSNVGENSASQDQLIGKKIADSIKEGVDNDVTAVETRVLDAIFRAMDNVVITRMEISVRSMTGSSGGGPKNVFQNPKTKFSSGNI